MTANKEKKVVLQSMFFFIYAVILIKVNYRLETSSVNKTIHL